MFVIIVSTTEQPADLLPGTPTRTCACQRSAHSGHTSQASLSLLSHLLALALLVHRVEDLDETIPSTGMLDCRALLVEADGVAGEGDAEAVEGSVSVVAIALHLVDLQQLTYGTTPMQDVRDSQSQGVAMADGAGL